MAHLVTGYAGSEHIQSADQGSFNAAFFGTGQFVMDIGNKFSASIISNNTVRILDGDMLMYGRHIRINPNSYEDLTIQNGTAGKNRYDLIVMTYKKNLNTGIETAELEVIKGEESSGDTIIIPDYTSGDILTGITKNQMPLYLVKIEGVVLSKLEKQFTICPTYKALAEQYEAEFKTACENHLNSLNILDSGSGIKNNTSTNQLAGALGVKELYNTLNTSVNGKAASNHTHDDRYYTEGEINNLLGGKADSGHTHDDRYYPEGEANNLFMLPVGSHVLRTGAPVNNGGFSYGTWTLYGSSTMDVSVNTGGTAPLLETVMFNIYKRTA